MTSRIARKNAALAVLALAIALSLALPPGGPARAQSPCGDAPAPRLTAGQTARVVPGNGVGNNLRTSPSAATVTLGVLADGEIVTVIAGPACAENLNWWQVRRWNGQTGYTAEGSAGVYWLEPWPVAAGPLAPGSAPAADSGRIAYLRQPVAAPGQPAPATELVIAAADGSTPVSVSPAGVDVRGFAWSPDGARLAFYDAQQLYVIDADGQNLRQLTQTAEATNSDPAWAPDGTRLAFTSDRDGNAEIYAINVDGSGLANLTQNPAADTDPTWSPDGAQIAFVSDRDAPGVERAAEPNIFVMGSNGANPLVLRTTPGAKSQPAWSPRGGEIAYLAEQNGVRTLYRSYAFENAALPFRLTQIDQDVVAFAWAPDASRLAYVTESSSGATTARELGSVRPDGADPLVYTADARAVESVAWSPDAAWLAFSSDRAGTFDVYLLRPSGAGLVAVASSDAQERAPQWQPDPAALGPAVEGAPGEQDLLLIYDASVPVFTLQNTSGAELDLRPLSFQGGERTVPASVWQTPFLASPLDAFKPVGCLMIWGFNLPDQPAPPECGDARQGWLSDSELVFWTAGTFDALYNGQVIATCQTGAGRCAVNLP